MTKPRSAAQRAAARKFMQKNAPRTNLNGQGRTFQDPDLVGKHLGYRKAAIIIDYRCSFESLIDGELYYQGMIVTQGPHTHFMEGNMISFKASELEVIA